MKLQIHIGTMVSGGYDDIGNPISHQVDIALSDRQQEGESAVYASMRIAHLALGTLAHVVADLLNGQDQSVIDQALINIGFVPGDDDDDDDDGGDDGDGGDGGGDNNDMPPHADQSDPHYGWNDGTTPDDLDEAGSVEARGVTDSSNKIPF